jgi:demethylmenaquinone methyltransferase/2-methoxy-6-polyprenyl-1,4-benzoquinol methylase
MKKDFDRVSDNYNGFMRFWHLYRQNEILEMLSFQGDEAVADLGGGTGHLAVHMARECREVYVVDESSHMLDKVPENGKIRTVQADAGSTGFPDNTFDAVTLTDVLHHIKNHTLIIEEIRRILKPGGKFLIYDFDARTFRAKILSFFESVLFGFSRLHYRSRRDIEAMLTAAGFTRKSLLDRGYYFISLWIYSGK